jgi:anthranilate synthase component 1
MGRYSPSREEFRAYARSANLIPIHREIVSDLDTPVSAFAKLGGAPYSFLLESVVGGEKWAAYSFIGVAPLATFVCHRGRVRVEWLDVRGGGASRVETWDAEDPARALGDLLARFRPGPAPTLPRFYGGAVGYFGYDIVRTFERLPSRAVDDLDLPECDFVLTDTLVIFDNLRQTLRIVANAHVEEGDDPDLVYRSACERVDAIAAKLRAPAPALAPIEPARRRLRTLRSNISEPRYLEAVRRAQEYILAGDAFQVVLSQRFEAERGETEPFDVYRALRVINPSPYLFHLVFPEAQVTGASPEAMVRLDGGRVEVRPIAGTRPRGATPDEDVRIGEELLADPKERAEHVMLIDLGRNDVGRIAEVGTVEVDERMVLERYSHVMHIVSNVRGRLGGGLSAIDVLRATFPAGTLTGAPKIRAMEIIDELEPTRRGIYGGAVGYLSFTGNMDLAIAIRTLVTKGDKVYVQAGAGIVAGSVPAHEHRECVNKAGAVLEALAMAGAGSKEA